MNKIDEKWKILAICCLVVFSSVGMSNAKGIFVTAICDGISITRAEFGLSPTICSLSTCLVTLFLPKIIRGLGIKKTVLIGTAVQSAAFFVISTASGKYVLYMGYALLGMGYSLFGSAVMLMVINRWFGKTSGTASSILTSFSGIGGGILSPILTSIISNVGWRAGEITMGVLTVLFCLPFLLYRRSLFPVQSENEDKGTVQQTAHGKEDIVGKIIICAVYGLPAFGLAVANVLSAVGISRDLSASESAVMVTVLMFGNVIFKLIYGPISDKLGSATVAAAMLCFTALSGVFMFCSKGKILLYVAAFLMGTLYAVVGLGMPLLAKEILGSEGYIDCYPKMNMTYTAVFAVSNPVVGKIYDSFGSYNKAMVIMVVICVLCIAMMIYMVRRMRKLNSTAD